MATTKALGSLDKPLRDVLGSEEKRFVELRPLELIDELTVALGSIQNDWPFARSASTWSRSQQGSKES